MHGITGWLRAASRLALMAAWTVALLVVYGGIVLTAPARTAAVSRLWHGGVCRIVGINREIRGLPARGHPVIFAANHVSYLDIVVLGGILPGCFIAKAEVADWPVIGWLAALQNTLFVERRASRAASQANEMRRRLSRGENLILFAEGTSSDGSRVLPFRSALFQAASRGDNILIQPVSLSYTHLNGQPLDARSRPLVDWYADMNLWPHLWKILGLGHLRAEILLHPPVCPDGFASRKELAVHCRDIVARGVVELFHFDRRQQDNTDEGDLPNIAVRSSRI